MDEFTSIWKKPGNVGEILSSDKSVEYAEYFRPKFEEILYKYTKGPKKEPNPGKNLSLIDELIDCLKNPEGK